MTEIKRKQTAERDKARRASGRNRMQKRDGKGRFKASASSRIRSVFRSGGKPSAAARRNRNKEPKKNVDVKAKVNKGNITPQTAENEYHKAVNDGFEKHEIGIINKTGGVDLTVGNVPRGEAAYYSGKNRKGRHDVTVGPKNVDAETLTHETIHILQEVDPKRPPLDKELTAFGKKELTLEERSLKEGLTEAETIARVKKPDPNSASFYPYIDEKNPWPLKEQDTEIIKGAMNGRQKGESPGVVAAIFDKLHLSRYKEEGSVRTAKEERDRRAKKK